VNGESSVSGSIRLRGVEVHNLKKVNLDIPRRQLVVCCGVSGSGKTSLAMDTLYAEGQRRYIETFSTYTRQFLERIEKPAAESIDGIPPSIAVASRAGSHSNRATVGTASETIAYLRLLFARAGTPTCPGCGRAIHRYSAEQISRQLARLSPSDRLQIGFTARPESDETCDELRQRLIENGFVRAAHDGRSMALDQIPAGALESVSSLDVVVDRLTAAAAPERLRESIELASLHGQGRCFVLVASSGETWGGNALIDAASMSEVELDGKLALRLAFSSHLECSACQKEIPEPEARQFSFDSPLGACPSCEGIGTLPALEPREKVKTKARSRTAASRTNSRCVCPDCQGTRLRAESLAVLLGGYNIAQISALPVHAALEFFTGLDLTGQQLELGRPMLDQIKSRLTFLRDVGLGYLTLDRPMPTLSQGESQRVALTTALGSSLVNMLYVLDEPSVGLHPQDTHRLLGLVQTLRDRGNSVVVIEHDEMFLRSADHIIEIGPGAGEQGGEIVYQGPYSGLLRASGSLTGDYLSGRRVINPSMRRRATTRGWIKLLGARGRNLQNVTVEFPLGVLCLVTGVSGAGKSTLVEDTLYPALRKHHGEHAVPVLPHEAIVGGGQIDEVVFVDQSPIGKSARGNPVTYIKAFDPIRQVFAETIEARTHNYSAGHFSFNVDGGRCSTCQGDGYLRIDMQFMSDAFVKCGQCHGRRFRKEILDVTYRGRSIADVLDMTVRQAFGFFRGEEKVQYGLKRLIDVGLDYLRLGQPATSLSAGESQRLKLAANLARAKRRRILFLLDEPTAGLHYNDIVKLLDCFDALLDTGHSLIVIEHNPFLLKAADYVIDIGPGPAEDGGRIVAVGTPEMIAEHRESATGRFLAAEFQRTSAVDDSENSHAPVEQT
jgi:excinuclease ABC subunit A